jgi:acylphosphatase
MPNEEMVRCNVIVTGQVQGVFFRASTMEQAQSLRVCGFVMNLPDGSVEMVLEGSRYGVEELVKWAHHGPPDAKVSEVIARYEPFKDEFRTFMVQ